MASSLVFGSGAVDPANASSYTFSGMSFGTAASDRYVVAVFAWRAAGTPTVSSVTIGGVSATLVGSARNNTGGNTSQSDMYIAAVPSGSTGSVVLNLSGGAVRCGCATYALYGINPTPIDVETVTPSGSAPQQIDATLSLASASHVIGGVFAGTEGTRSWINTASGDLSAGSPTVSMFSGLSWSGLTQRYVAEIEATNGAFNAGVFAAWAQVSGAGAQNLTASLYEDADTFYSATVGRGAVTLTAARFDNAGAFYGPSVAAGAVTLAPILFEDGDTFFAATVGQGGGPQTLTASLFADGDTFYTATVGRGAVTLTAPLFEDADTFYAATILAVGGQTLTAGLFENAPEFFGASVGLQRELLNIRIGRGVSGASINRGVRSSSIRRNVASRR